MNTGGLLQSLSILDWNWDDISMDFIVGLPLTAHKFDLIWVIVDRFTKSTHFVPVNTRYNVQRYAEIYIARVLCLHRVLKMIIFDRVIPRSEKEEPKPLHVCPGCSNHTYSNNMINRCNFR
jgi:hypothetical protein